MKEFDFSDLISQVGRHGKRATVSSIKEGILVTYMNEAGEGAIILYKNEKCDKVQETFKLNVLKSDITVNVLITDKYEDVIEYLSDVITIQGITKETFDANGFMRLVSKDGSGVSGFSRRPNKRSRRESKIWPIVNYSNSTDCVLECFGIDHEDVEAQSIICTFTFLINRVSVTYYKKNWRTSIPYPMSTIPKTTVRLLDYVTDLGMNEIMAEGVINFISRSLSAIRDEDDDFMF